MCSKRREQRIDQIRGYNFFILIEEVNNSDDFVLNKYKHIRSSLFINETYNKLVVHILFDESILSINIEVK